MSLYSVFFLLIKRGLLSCVRSYEHVVLGKRFLELQSKLSYGIINFELKIDFDGYLAFP